jgi:hypothetical protein
MKARHTPGPWKVDNSGVTIGDHWLSDDMSPYDENHPDLALIAAAPELLQALELIEVDKDGDGFICSEAMAQVRAAISKARGEA